MRTIESLRRFFESNIHAHSEVATCVRLKTPNEDEFIYEIARKHDLSTVRVCLSDAYEYGSDSYAVRPREIGSGDFILVDSFVPGADSMTIEEARRDKIAIGPWGKLKGALNFPELWKYRSPQERELDARKRS
jgi:hypothetical protein